MNTSPSIHSSRLDQSTLDRIQQALAGLQFGSVEIAVHHGRIVQIERREKLRLDTPPQTWVARPGSARPTQTS